MKKKIFVFFVSALMLLSFASCDIPKEDSNEHKHSVLPGSDVCDSCGEKIKSCSDCQMVNDADAEECWFCHANF